MGENNYKRAKKSLLQAIVQKPLDGDVVALVVAQS